MEKLVVGSFVFLLLLQGVLMQSGAGPGRLCEDGPTFKCHSYLVCDDEDNHCKKKALFPCFPAGGDYCVKNAECKIDGAGVCASCVCNDGYTSSTDRTMCVPSSTTQMTQATPTTQMTQAPPQMTQATVTPQTTQAPDEDDGGCTVVVSLTLLTASLLATGLL